MCSGSCFTAGTLIRVHPATSGATIHNGLAYRKIEDIKIGDRVLAYSEESGRLSYRRVKQTFIRQAEKLYVITYGDGTVIKTTWNHPFYIQRRPESARGLRSNLGALRRAKGLRIGATEGRGWVKAKDLAGGDMSYTAGYVRTLNQEPDFSRSYGDTVNLNFNDPNSGTAGSAAGIVSVRVMPQATAATVYNFEVAQDHTYFVSKRRVLVHNGKYAVVKGDTIAKLMKNTGMTAKEIYDANPGLLEQVKTDLPERSKYRIALF